MGRQTADIVMETLRYSDYSEDKNSISAGAEAETPNKQFFTPKKDPRPEENREHTSLEHFLEPGTTDMQMSKSKSVDLSNEIIEEVEGEDEIAIIEKPVDNETKQKMLEERKSIERNVMDARDSDEDTDQVSPLEANDHIQKDQEMPQIIIQGENGENLDTENHQKEEPKEDKMEEKGDDNTLQPGEINLEEASSMELSDQEQLIKITEDEFGEGPEESAEEPQNPETKPKKFEKYYRSLHYHPFFGDFDPTIHNGNKVLENLELDFIPSEDSLDQFCEEFENLDVKYDYFRHSKLGESLTLMNDHK